MSVKIIFEAHGTTFDNEAHRSSGWNDVALSPLGEEQSRELGQRYKGKHLDVVFCSTLQRSVKTAELAFPKNKVQIIPDERLRECNYGQLTQAPSDQVDAEKPQRISTPFPDGESYEQTTKRMGEFLDEVKLKLDGATIMIIGHRATQYGLEYWINHRSLESIITAPWKWQPGWEYTL